MTALSQFRGHPMILAFCPADFSPICVLEGTSVNNARRGLPLTRAHVEQIFPKLTPARIHSMAEQSNGAD
jgi:peroxiredoxin